MGKIIAKVIYAAFGVILAFLVYVVAYNSGATTNYYNLLNSAANSEDKEDIVKTFSAYGIPYDSVPVYNSNTESNDLVIYNGINQLNLSYYPENKEKTYAEIQFMYYFFVFNPTYNYSTINDTSNLSGLRFYGENGYYDFHYVVDKSINTDLNEYQAKPQTVEDALLYSSRNMATTYSDYNFIFTAVSELFVNALSNNVTTSTGEVGLGKITGVDILNNRGAVVDVNSSDTETGATADFDFSQKFYTDLTDFKYYSRVNQEGEDETVEINGEEVTYKYQDATEYLNNFSDTFDENEDYASYSTGYSKDKVYNSRLTWTSIGITVLFVVILIILFVLIFYFKSIKSLIFRDHRRQTQRIVPNKPINTNQKTQFDKVNEQRAKDLAKKRAAEAEEKKALKEARDAEIKARGNSIVVNNNENDVVDAEFTPVEENVAEENVTSLEENNNTELEEKVDNSQTTENN